MQRVQWIDTYRGILIIMIVLGHQSLEHKIIIDNFTAVRIPAFFFISGFLLSSRYTDLELFSMKRFRQLIVPYFIFYFINWILWVSIHLNDGTDLLIPLNSMLYGCVVIEESIKENINAVPLWFITALFVTEIYMFFIKNIFKTSKKILIVITISSFLGYLSSLYLPIRMPWNMEVALSALFFYGLGYIVKKEQLLSKINEIGKIKSITLMIVSLLGAVTFSLNSMPIVYSQNNLGSNIVFTYLGALLGIIGFIFLAKLVDGNKFLEFLGRNTFIILAFHLSAIYFLHRIVNIIGIPFESTMHSNLWGVIYMISSFILLLPVIYIINHYAPYILNRKSQRN